MRITKSNINATKRRRKLHYSYSKLDRLKIHFGDIVEIDNHKILCGDSKDYKSYETILEDNYIDMVVTSPPYNQGGLFYSKCKDNLSKDSYYNFLMAVLNNTSIWCNQDTSVLWNVGYNNKSRDDYGKIVFSDYNPFTVKETIVWNKLNSIPICYPGNLTRRAELIFLMSMGEKYYTNQQRELWSNIWTIRTQGSNNLLNSACFPVELPETGITKFCVDGGIVFDPFLGNGTTLIASENLERRCIGIEIDENLVYSMIKRYLKHYPNADIYVNGDPVN